MENCNDLTENDLNDEYVQLKMAFPKLKKVCDPILRESDDNVSAANLKETLQTIRTPILEKYSCYIYAPIFIRLSRRYVCKTGPVCPVLECLKIMLEYVPVDSASLFMKVFDMTFLIIYSKSDDELISNHSEELKLLVVTCLSMVVTNAPTEVLEAVYTQQNVPTFMAAIYHVAILAKREKFIQLRIASLQCLQDMLQLRNVESTPAWRKQVAELLVRSLPGVALCAVVVATSTDTLNHKVIVEAIHLWGRLIGLMMEDKASQPVQHETYKLLPKEQSTAPDPSGPYSPIAESHGKRTDQWLKESAIHLTPSTDKMLSLQQHDHPKVRRQLVAEITHILSFAPKNMRFSVQYLVDALICLGQDSDQEVAEAGKLALDEFSRSCELDASSKKLVEIVEENFHSVVTRFPRILHGLNLSLKEKQLLLLTGYVDVLGARHLPGLLNSSSHLDRLLKSLYTAANLDCSNVTLLLEQAERDLDQEVIGHQRVWMDLKHCGSAKFLTSLQELASKLLKYSECASIVYPMLYDFQNQPAYRKEITLLLNFMFDPNKSVKVDYDLANQVLRTVMDLKLWDLPVSVQNGVEKPLAQSNVVQICLLCELVATLAAVQGAESFVPNLFSCLYPLLECAGSPLYAVSSAGLASIGSLATLYGGDVGHLVANNVDYLSYHVTLNLRHAHRNPRVLSVLSVIMNHSSYQVFPSLYEIVKDVLVQSCDTFQDINASAFLQVFLTFVSRILEWEQNESEQKLPEPPRVAPSCAWDEIHNYYKASCMAHEYEDQPMSETEVPENLAHPMEASEESTEDKKVPDHIQLTIEMLNRSLHFLPSKNIPRQIQVLEILEKGVLILSKWKDLLLPIVHKIWSPLVQKFSTWAHPLVLHRAFMLLCTMATTSREFIADRTSKEAIPFLCKYLALNARITRTERERSYKMTQPYKLVRAFLSGLGDLCACLDLPEYKLESVIDAAVPYLSSAQPLPLQEAAFNTIKTISTKDPNIVWIRLMDALGSEFNAPSSNLRSFKVEPSFTDETYRDNALKLLSECG